MRRFSNTTTNGAVAALLHLFFAILLFASLNAIIDATEYNACELECLTSGGATCDLSACGGGGPPTCATPISSEVTASATFGRACYFAVGPPSSSASDGVTYAQALATCRANHSDLASVHSEAERSFLYGWSMAS